jgi:hypothetical protein
MMTSEDLAACATPDPLIERIATLEYENARLRELSMLYLQIAFREGFRAAVMWVPDQWSGEAHGLSSQWVAETAAEIAKNLADPEEKKELK